MTQQFIDEEWTTFEHYFLDTWYQMANDKVDNVKIKVA